MSTFSEDSVNRDRGGRFANKSHREAKGGTSALSSSTPELTPTEMAEHGRKLIRAARNIRVGYNFTDSTRAGDVVGQEAPGVLPANYGISPLFENIDKSDPGTTLGELLSAHGVGCDRDGSDAARSIERAVQAALIVRAEERLETSRRSADPQDPVCISDLDDMSLAELAVVYDAVGRELRKHARQRRTHRAG